MVLIDINTFAGDDRSGRYRPRNVRPRTSSPANTLYSAAGTPLPDTSPSATMSVCDVGHQEIVKIAAKLAR